MDAQYVKGMLNNPDMQPNAAMNRWIAVTPLGLSCWHASLMYLYSALYDSCELIMCTTGSLDAHTGHSRNLDT